MGRTPSGFPSLAYVKSLVKLVKDEGLSGLSVGGVRLSKNEGLSGLSVGEIKIVPGPAANPLRTARSVPAKPPTNRSEEPSPIPRTRPGDDSFKPHPFSYAAAEGFDQ